MSFGARGRLRFAFAFAPAVFSGLLLVLSFPPADLGWVGWIALVPLILSVLPVSPGRGLAAGTVCGLVFFGGLLFWILSFLLRFSGMAAPLCPIPWLLLIAYLALFPAVFGGAVALIARRRGEGAALAAVPILWTGLEWLRGTILTGFPWGLLGASQQGVAPVLQVASIAGVYGLSFLLAAFAAAVGGAFRWGGADRRGRAGLVAAVLLPAASLGWGWTRLARPVGEGPSLRVACVQGNTPPDAPEAEGPSLLAASEDLTLQAARLGAQLVLWAESSTPYGFEMNPSYRAFVENLSRRAGASIVLGSIGGPTEGPYSNSAFLVRPGGESAPSYRKIHLVPYGEYVPLGRLMPFVRRFSTAIGEFEPGDRPAVWLLDGVRVTPLICYEAIFPQFARSAVGEGGEVLLNLTNDGWFGSTAGPAQHLALARIRSVETARPLVRAAETGISAIFDARGRELARGGLQRREIVSATVSAGRETTIFQRTGGVLPVGCAIIAFILVVPLIRIRTRVAGYTAPPAASLPEAAPPEAEERTPDHAGS